MSAGEEIPEWMVEFPRSANPENRGVQTYTFYEEWEAREFMGPIRTSFPDRTKLYRRTITLSDWEPVDDNPEENNR